MQISMSFTVLNQMSVEGFVPRTASAALSKLTFLSARIAQFLSPLEKMNRIWKLVIFLGNCAKQLLSKIMKCFQSIIKQGSTFSSPPSSQLPSIKQERQQELPGEGKEVEKESELRLLFNNPVNYEKFHDSILNYQNNFFNNYHLETYRKLKDCDWSLLEKCQSKQEKEHQAGIAVYDAIVKLFVKRFLDQYPALDQKIYLPSLKVIALGIAIKNSWDEAIYNTYLQPFIVPYMGIKKHNKMENEFLKGMNWNLSLDELRK